MTEQRTIGEIARLIALEDRGVVVPALERAPLVLERSPRVGRKSGEHVERPRTLRACPGRGGLACSWRPRCPTCRACGGGWCSCSCARFEP